MRQRGFTLIELIVVMAIVVLLAITGYKATMMALSLQANTQKTSEQLREFQLGLFILGRDLDQIQQKPLPENAAVFQSASQEDELFSFYLSADPLAKTGIRFVHYQFKDGALIQDMWVNGKEYQTVLIQKIKSIDVTFYDDDNQPLKVWQDQSVIPKWIKISFNHEHYGEFVFEKELMGHYDEDA